MRLTIKDETHEETIHGITLDNGIRPCISSINNDHGFNIPPIEPAMWFKTLILRSIVIDCVDNTICYSISDEEEHYLNGKTLFVFYFSHKSGPIFAKALKQESCVKQKCLGQAKVLGSYFKFLQFFVLTKVLIQTICFSQAHNHEPGLKGCLANS